MTKVELAELAMKMFAEFLKMVIPMINELAEDIKHKVHKSPDQLGQANQTNQAGK